MKKASLEKIIENGIRFLSELFPLKAHLYFPLLNATLVWAIKRTSEWKEKIFSWKVYLEPDFIKVKPDEFILSFFKINKALSKAYQAEIKEKNFEALREAFRCLYPILGLEDPFVSALFRKELESGDFRKIVEEFDAKVSKAKNDIEAIKSTSRLLKGLKTFAEEMLSLNVDLLSQPKIQKMIVAEVKAHFEEKNE